MGNDLSIVFRPFRLTTSLRAAGILPAMATKLRRRVRRHHYYIKEWREDRGLTLKELGARIRTHRSPDGVDANTVWRWENEQNRLNAEKLATIADALSLADPDALLRPPGARESLDALLKDADDDTFNDVVDIARRLMRRTGS